MPRKPKAIEDAEIRHKKAKFLQAFASEPTISGAAAAIGIQRAAHYKWLESDPAYAALFASAQKDACDTLEREAFRRAVHGVEEPVFYKGIETGAVRKFSDTLLIFLMKGAMPDKYRERADVTTDGQPLPSGSNSVIFYIPSNGRDSGD